MEKIVPSSYFLTYILKRNLKINFVEVATDRYYKQLKVRIKEMIN